MVQLWVQFIHVNIINYHMVKVFVRRGDYNK